MRMAAAVDCTADMNAEGETTTGETTESSERATVQADVWSRKVFVGNIGYRQTWRDLKDFFSKFGEVLYAQIVLDHLKRHSRGIGFVEFSSPDAMERCLQAPPQELVLEGRTLRVNYAKESKKATFTVHPPVPTLPPDANTEEAITGELQDNNTGPNLTLDEWRYIFAHLTVPERIRLERVCKLWREVALQLWREQKSLTCNGFDFGMVLTDKVLVSILNRCRGSLRSLDLCVAGQVLTEYALTVVGHFCPLLEKLNMSGVNATNTAMRDLTRACTHLQWIELRKCNYVSEKGLWWLFNHCKQLQHVNFSDNISMTGKCFFMLGPSVRTMKANGCIRLCDFGIEELSKKCPQLQELDLGGCSGLTDAALTALSSLTDLEVLDIACDSMEVSRSKWSCLGCLHHLRELRLDGNRNISDSALSAIIEGCPRLRSLSLADCRSELTGEGLGLLTRLQELTSLDVSYLPQVTDGVLEKIACGGLLEKLRLHACPNVTEPGLVRVLVLCEGLHLLDLSNNLHMDGELLDHLHHLPCPRSPLHPLCIVIGGTSMVYIEAEGGGGAPLEQGLPPGVTLCRRNLAKRQASHDHFLLMPDPWSDEEEEEEEEWEDEDGDEAPVSALNQEMDHLSLRTYDQGADCRQPAAVSKPNNSCELKSLGNLQSPGTCDSRVCEPSSSECSGTTQHSMCVVQEDTWEEAPWVVGRYGAHSAEDPATGHTGNPATADQGLEPRLPDPAQQAEVCREQRDKSHPVQEQASGREASEHLEPAERESAQRDSEVDNAQQDLACGVEEGAQGAAQSSDVPAEQRPGQAADLGSTPLSVGPDPFGWGYGDDDDDFDEDYDEFLDNDDPIAMERWECS